MPPTSPPDLATRDRLLEAGGEVFAARGFRAATVREICTRARANVAAVHYHFGDKEALYREVIEHAARVALERYPPDLDLPAGADAEERLRAFVRSFMLRLLAEGVPAWLWKVVAREMTDPTPALDELVEKVIRPLFSRLLGIVSELLGRGTDPETVILCARSVVGQCVFYRHAQEVIARLRPGEAHTQARIERIAEHVTRFSLAAIREQRSRR